MAKKEEQFTPAAMTLSIADGLTMVRAQLDLIAELRNVREALVAIARGLGDHAPVSTLPSTAEQEVGQTVERLQKESEKQAAKARDMKAEPTPPEAAQAPTPQASETHAEPVHVTVNTLRSLTAELAKARPAMIKQIKDVIGRYTESQRLGDVAPEDFASLYQELKAL